MKKAAPRKVSKRPAAKVAAPVRRLATGAKSAAKATAKAATKATTKPVANSRAERGVARRDAILAAALDEFSARGFEATRLDDVARRAGIAKGTIYLYFRDKDTLFQELVRAMLAPLIAGIEAMGATDLPIAVLAERFVDLFVREIYETRRQDVIRLMIAEGRRFPKLAEFYYREVLSPIFDAMRGLLKRAAARGEVPEALVEFPQLVAAPGLVAIIWNGLFERYAPLDVRRMLKTHIELLFAPRRAV
ncbi:MAG: TetR/AcrR family transcriptional regulator [Pseudolabrys sp.]|nr:TetR/AcrR family transcriptional regulator [Pseudolabrys sp.]